MEKSNRKRSGNAEAALTPAQTFFDGFTHGTTEKEAILYLQDCL
jgi:hypothetical protein